MRIGFNGRFLGAPTTGVQRFAGALLERLAQRADITLFLPRGVEPPGGVSTAVVRGRLRGNAWEQLELPHQARTRCDVLLHPANTARPGRTPFVLVLHDVLPLTHPHWFDVNFARWYRSMLPRAARAAARIVTVSEWSRREICRATRATPGRVVVAPQGLAPFDAAADDHAVQRVRERFQLPSRFVLAVGGGDPRKNVGFLVTLRERWARLHEVAPDVVVAGGVDERVHGAARQDAGGGVIALGRVTDDELRALYTAADALCFPSLAEGFGRPPLEAIACGTPAVAAPYGPAAEVLGGVDAARVVPLEIDAWIDTLREILRAPPSTARAAAALRARWSWDAAADVVLNACEAARRPHAAMRVSDVSRTPPSSPGDRGPRIAIVHDWLTGMRGGERVLDELLDMYPAADVFTLLHVRGSVAPRIESHVVATSFVDRLPVRRGLHRAYLPLYPAAVERLDTSGYDLIVSSSHCAAKGVAARGAPHLCYCHTPMRYVWDRYDDYFGAGRAAAPVRLAMAALAPRLRAWDARTARRIDRIVANSAHVRERIRACWGRDAAVVHPPVDVERFAPAPRREDFWVVAGALVPYKRVDLAVRAFNDLGRRLLVVGEGPEYARLRALAARTIEFTGRMEDEELAGLLGRTRGLVMPMVEDFGIVAVEAQAAGAPVVALAAGGALETVIGWRPDAPAGATGVFFDRQTPDALADAVRQAEGITFDIAVLRAHARRFGRDVFRAAIAAHVDALLAGGASLEADAHAVMS